MRYTGLAALLVAAGWLSVIASPVAAKPDAAEDVLAAEHARAEAIIHKDFATLEKYLGDDLTYCHASAHVDDRASFLKTVKSGELNYLKVESKDPKVRVFGNTAVITGQFLVQTSGADGKPRDPDHSFVTMIYAKRDGRWQLINYQATRPVPAPAVKPVGHE